MPHISVIAELERCGVDYEPASEDEVKARCPFHPDDKASCSINIQKEVFKCHAATCGQAGDIVSYFAALLKTTRQAIYEDLSRRYDLEQVKVINPTVIERDHEEIWSQAHLLKELYLRGVTDADIRRHRLGSAKGRVTIPVKNAAGSYVNIRRYLPGAPGADKMRNTRGRSQIRLFPVEQLKYEDVVLCGGEVKAIVAARILNQKNFGAVSPTGGEGNWHHSLTPLFRGKRVWVMMDVDEGGRKATQTYAAILSQVAAEVHVVDLPLDVDKYPHGDVNDFVASEDGDLWSVILGAPRWTPPTKVVSPDEEPVDVKFSDTTRSANVGKRMRFQAMVSASNERSFVIPKNILVNCDKSAECCAVCAVFPKEDKLFVVSPESPAILQMIGVADEALDRAIRGAIGVPRRCDKVSFDVSSHYDAEDVRVNPSLEITNRDSERTMQQAVCIGCESELNNTYEFTGRLYPHPKTQQATLLVSGSKATLDALSQYQPRDLHLLRAFRPERWELGSLEEKLHDVYSDLEANVTHIYLRHDTHLFVDLAYHSALLLDIDGKRVKGWTEVLIVGDPSCGKSEVATNLMRHYRLGEKTECKNASVAGLIGGLQPLGGEWFISWGVLPTQDKRLVILEELKGATTEVIAHLTDTRSSGVAELNKIKKRRTFSRTRICALSNARKDRTVASFNFGIEMIKELIGAPEDVRRFDAALVVAGTDVDPARLNALTRTPPQVPHVYTSDLCRELILWAWTRRHDEVVFDADARDAMSTEATRLSEKFSDQIPLVDRGSMRYKLARLATAMACRTFSTGSEETVARVRLCHVQFVVKTLERVYCNPNFAYDAYSEAARVTSHMIDPEHLQKFIEGLPFPHEVREQLLYNDPIDLQDLADWMGDSDRTQAQTFLSLMVRKRALKRDGRSYRKTPEFITWLKSLRLVSQRPGHIPETQEKF